MPCPHAFKTVSPSQGQGGFNEREMSLSPDPSHYQGPVLGSGLLSLALCLHGSHQPSPVVVSLGGCFPGLEARPTLSLDPAYFLPQDSPNPGSAPTSGPTHSSLSTPLIGFIQSRPHPQGNIYINDFARLVSSDHEAVNGVLHFIDRVLLPPEALHWEPDAAPIPQV